MTAQNGSRTTALWPYAGFIAVVLGLVATWIVQFQVSQSLLETGGQALLDDLDTGTNEVLWRVSSGIGIIAAASLIVFAAGFRRMLDHRAGAETLLPRVTELALVAAAAGLLVAFVFRAMVFDSMGYYQDSPDAMVAFFALSLDVPLAAWAMVGLATVAAVFGALRMRVLPRWFGWVSALLVLVFLVALLTGTPFPTNVPAGLWLLAASFVGRREGRQSMSAYLNEGAARTVAEPLR